MDLYLRAAGDWSSLGRFDVSSWDLPLDSVTLTDAGSVTVPAVLPDLSGAWAVLDGRLYAVKKCAAKTGATSLSLALPESAFDRSIRYEGDGEETYGDFIAETITAQWIEQTDPAYAMPYLTVSNSDHTAFAIDTDKGSLISFVSILQAAADLGIRLRFTPGRTGVAVYIAYESPSEHVLIDGVGGTAVKSATVSDKLVAKVTVYAVAKESGELISAEDWYWLPDGTVSRSPPQPRIPGTWTSVELTVEPPAEGEEPQDPDTESAALAAVAKNDASYKIDLLTGRILRLRDTVVLRFRDQVYQGAVTRLGAKTGDDRTAVRLGTLPVTLTEQVAAKSSGSGGAAAAAASRPVTYAALPDKPQIEGVELIGNKTFPELHLRGLTNIELEAMLQL